MNVAILLEAIILQFGLANSLSCTDTSQCASINVTEDANHIYCYGYLSCYAAKEISITTVSNKHIYCNGYQACKDALSISNEFGNILCRGAQGCQSIIDSSISAYGSAATVECSSYRSCAFSVIDESYSLSCTGDESCYQSVISGIEEIYADGYATVQGATISSSGISGNTMKVYMYGEDAGSGSTLICSGSSHTCYLYCRGYGCNGATLDTSNSSLGTWVVSCDESDDKICPNGYESMSSSVIAYCRDDSECSYENVIGSTVYCDGYYGCRGSTSYDIESASSSVYCRGLLSCSNVGNIISSGVIECSATQSCNSVDLMKTSGKDITCYGYQSCLESIMYTSNGDVYCHSTSSCQSATINDANKVVGYGYQSLASGTISNANVIEAYGGYSLQSSTINHYNGTLNVSFFGYLSGDSASINCYSNSSVCLIFCYMNGCENVDIDTCEGTCIVDCDESIGISCPNGYGATTSVPTTLPTTIPTVLPTPQGVQSTASMQTTELSVIATSVTTGNEATEASNEMNSSSTDCGCDCDTNTNDQFSGSSSGKPDNGISGVSLYLVVGLSGLSVILLLVIGILVVRVKEKNQEISEMMDQIVPATSPQESPIPPANKKIESKNFLDNPIGNEEEPGRAREDSLLGIDLQNRTDHVPSFVQTNHVLMPHGHVPSSSYQDAPMAFGAQAVVLPQGNGNGNGENGQMPVAMPPRQAPHHVAQQQAPAPYEPPPQPQAYVIPGGDGDGNDDGNGDVDVGSALELAVRINQEEQQLKGVGEEKDRRRLKRIDSEYEDMYDGPNGPKHVTGGR